MLAGVCGLTISLWVYFWKFHFPRHFSSLLKCAHLSSQICLEHSVIFNVSTRRVITRAASYVRRLESRKQQRSPPRPAPAPREGPGPHQRLPNPHTLTPTLSSSSLSPESPLPGLGIYQVIFSPLLECSAIRVHLKHCIV